MTVGDARTWLFVPGNRPERFDKAAASGADEVILDLEDAVDPAGKDAAREAVADWLATGSAWVRVNGVGATWHDDDLTALAGLPGLRGVILPKSEDPLALAAIGRRMGVGLIALIESALGVHRAAVIAAVEEVDRLAFGSIDYAIDIGAEETDSSLLLARSTLVLASRLGGLPSPIDGVTTDLRDADVITAAARSGRELGFGAKLCVHPAQIEPIARAFAPSPAEIDWARTVLDQAAAGPGASAVGGQMIDKPVLDRARRILGSSA